LDLKYVKRFLSTRLDWDDFAHLTQFAKDLGFLTSATPFDEYSVAKVVEHGHDVLKVASASFTDWPLWEAVAATDLPIIASTAGASIEEVDRVVAFLENRQKSFALMHCVAAYPTKDEDLNLNRIDVLRRRYASVPIGYSTHERPDNNQAAGLALAKGAAILERHVGVPTANSPLNDYSSEPATIGYWLQQVESVTKMLGTDASTKVNAAEIAALKGLSRGVYARSDISVGSLIGDQDVYFAIPLQENQVSANDWSKYLETRSIVAIASGDAIRWTDIDFDNRNKQILGAVNAVTELLNQSGVTYPLNSDLELSHHYGLDAFRDYGLAMITVVNREYCKKILIVLPGQQHPEQYHLEKEESFHLLHGALDLWLDDQYTPISPGDVVLIKRGVRHKFSSPNGAVFEEISSTHITSDSFYVDDAINSNSMRKSFVKYWGNAPS